MREITNLRTQAMEALLLDLTDRGNRVASIREIRKQTKECDRA